MLNTFDELKSQKNEAQKKRSIAGLIVSSIIVSLNLLNIFVLGIFIFPVISTAIFAAFLLLFVASIRGLIHSSQSGYAVINKFCNDTPDPTTTMKKLEKAWNEGYNFGEGRMNTEFIICTMGIKVKIINLYNAVLAFHAITNSDGGNATYIAGKKYHSLIVFRNDGKSGQHASIQSISIKKVLEYINKNCPDIAIGENKETMNLLRQMDWQRLKSYAHSQRNIK